MKQAVLIITACALVAAAAAAAGSTKPLPALRVDVAGWAPKASYTVGQAVTYRFAIRNRNRVPLEVVEVRMTLPKGWTVIPTSTLPSPARTSGSTVVWRYTAVPARIGIRRLSVSLQVGGKPGSACTTAVVRAVRPATVPHTTRRCNKVVDAVFH
jgi:uncharacterized repeat protein (TIGR01451 family)